MNTILEITNLNKKYGHIQAVNNLNLNIKEGTVFGLLGPNGSGKTTTLGMLLGVTKPQSGSYKWFGENPSAESRKKIGAILEHPIFYPYMSAVENLKVVCQIKGIAYAEIDKALKKVNLFERKDDKFKGFSLGMKQRLAIASALLCNPSVMILDEPTNGLDPQGINEIRELITDIATSGKTIILASHLLDEVQKVCSDFAILSSGNLIYQGNVNTDLTDQPIVEAAAEDMTSLKVQLEQHPNIYEIKKVESIFVFKVKQPFSLAELNKNLAKNGVFVSHLIKRKKTLEKRFLEVLKENA